MKNEKPKWKKLLLRTASYKKPLINLLVGVFVWGENGDFYFVTFKGHFTFRSISLRISIIWLYLKCSSWKKNLVLQKFQQKKIIVKLIAYFWYCYQITDGIAILSLITYLVCIRNFYFVILCHAPVKKQKKVVRKKKCFKSVIKY